MLEHATRNTAREQGVRSKEERAGSEEGILLVEKEEGMVRTSVIPHAENGDLSPIVNCCMRVRILGWRPVGLVMS